MLASPSELEGHWLALVRVSIDPVNANNGHQWPIPAKSNPWWSKFEKPPNGGDMGAIDPAEIDAVVLNFSPTSLQILNMVLAVVMFSIALELKPSDFTRLAKTPKALITGLFSQFLLLPALTFGIVLATTPQPSIALGLMLVAACPGGNISNFITHRAGGNAALSVSLC